MQINSICNGDDVMKKIVDNVGECKIGKNKQDIFAYLIGLIIGQKIRFSMARKLRGKMYEETKSYNFTPQDILNIDLEKIGIGNPQKNTIINTTNYFIKNNINSKNPSKNDILKLQSISGIGIWTISTLLIEYGLDENLFPLNDKHVNSQIKKYYKIKDNEITDFVEKWAPYKSFAFWYLWKNDLA
jgi:3-methyladenine DNA glycosylase/8-oxoguanine DNA glycosylase